jgi:hypothetical protein
MTCKLKNLLQTLYAYNIKGPKGHQEFNNTTTNHVCYIDFYDKKLTKMHTRHANFTIKNNQPFKTIHNL